MKKIFFIIVWQFALLIQVAYSQATLEDRLKQHVYTLAADSLMGRKAGSEYIRMAADYIAAQWKEIGIAPLVGDSYFIPFMDDKYHNLAGVIEGSDPVLKYEYIIVGAHHDHLGFKTENGETVIYNGADDNASGVAAIIELGRNLKAMQPLLRRSVILIAFDAEELGLHGSNDFAANPPFPAENIKLMISIDMVGWYQESGYIKYMGTSTIRNGKQLLLAESSVPNGLNVRTQKFEKSVFTATDTRGFAQRGIPTFAVTTGLKSPYHKPEDMAHLIDYEGMALITEHLTNVVAAVSQDDSFQASGKVASIHQSRPRRFILGISANVGTNYHHYTAGAIDGKSKFSGGIGLTGQFNYKFLAIRPEVYFDFINAKHPSGDISTQGITAPLNIFVLTTGSSPIAIGAFVGPYYSYRFKGEQNGSTIFDIPIDGGTGYYNEFKREEIGLNFGFEMQIVKFRLGYTNRRPFTNFTQAKNPDGAHIRNRTSFFSLGYAF